MLQHQAQHDPLTSLPNRNSFFEALTTTATESEDTYGVMYLDLDGFKDVNETLGHAAGDQLLVRFARRLERCVRPFDLVARLAGDEFAVLLRRVGDADNAVRVADRILTQTNSPFSLSDGQADVSTSIGIALGRSGDDPDRVVRDADFALRHAKVSGKNRFAIFDEHLSRDQASQHRIASDLKRALPDGQLEVHYQPLIDARDKQVVGAEALMRWRHPERGYISPEEFVPIAERTGEIVPMEGWLIHTALTQLETWNEYDPSLKLSVNLSGRQLEQSEFPATFARLLSETGANPDNVVLEVTETYAMQRPREAGRQLRALADLGVTLAIDDFGTGYSNLGHLQHLPFRIVKIDRSFLENVPEDQRNFALVRTIIAMAQALELEVVAEGVETKTQADFLYWEGATWLQGFYFGKPVDAKRFAHSHLNDLV
jgi:diguanylate cyclase (GGDEF)-like protein